MAVQTASLAGPTVLAHSALLTLTATPWENTLALQVVRVADHQLIAGPGRVTATLDGRSVPLTAGPGGTYLLPMADQGAGAHSLGVVVSHDGIRELLTGTITVPRQRSAIDLLQGHGMFAWWVLNIAVVLIAVVVISRRTRS